MIATWMLAAIVLGALAAFAAAATASLAGSFRRQQRWAWLVAMVVSVGVPPLLGLASHESREPAALLPVASVAAPDAGIVTSASTAVAPPSPVGAHAIDLLLLGGWAATSIVLAVIMLLTWRRTARQVTSLAQRMLFGQCVTASTDFGPAVVGWVHPRVVVPLWVFELPEAEQRLVLLHETQHMQSRDQLVLLGGIALVVLMPWNVSLWWQLRRLRVAMEVDCDARVALAPAERARYGRLLITAHEQRQVLSPMILSVRTSSLRERLHALLQSGGPTRGQLALRSSAVLACAAVATRVPVPYVKPLLDDFASQPAHSANQSPVAAKYDSVAPSRTAATPTSATGRTKPMVRRPAVGFKSGPMNPVTTPISTGLAEAAETQAQPSTDSAARTVVTTATRFGAGRGSQTQSFVPDSSSGLAAPIGGGRAGRGGAPSPGSGGGRGSGVGAILDTLTVVAVRARCRQVWAA